MNETKILLKICVPRIEEKYDVFMPINKRIKNIIELIEDAIVDLSEEHYIKSGNPKLYNKDTGKELEYNLSIKELGLKNGDSVILL